MRTITIGDRGIKDIKQDELHEFLCKFGHCAGLEYWGEPIFTLFKNDSTHFDNFISFKFHQINKENSNKSERDGTLSFGHDADDFRLYLTTSIRKEEHNSHIMNIKEMNWFLDLGFDLPITGIGKKHKREQTINELENK